MIVSHRKSTLEARGASVSTDAVFSESFRVHAVHNQGVVSDDRVSTLAYQRLGKVSRPIATLVLEGVARIEAFGARRWLEVGDLSVVEAKSAILMRQSRAGEPYRALVFEWEPTLLGSRPSGFTTTRASAEAIAEANEITIALASSIDPEPIVARILALFAGMGVGPAWDGTGALPPSIASERESQPMVELARALDELLSDMRDRPMIVDLHERLGVSERTVNRMVQGFNSRFGFNASTWQDARSRRRVLLSAVFLSARGATASEVAAAMGYASLPSLTRALRQAGMPRPSDIPDVVARLLEDPS